MNIGDQRATVSLLGKTWGKNKVRNLPEDTAAHSAWCRTSQLTSNRKIVKQISKIPLFSYSVLVYPLKYCFLKLENENNSSIHNRRLIKSFDIHTVEYYGL